MNNFEVFDGVIYPSGQIPAQISDRIDASLLDRFHAGKSEYFRGIESYYPEIYKFLISSMSELTIVRSDLGSRPLFYFAMLSPDCNIFSSIPRTFRESKTKISEREYYNSLPEHLKPFYFGFYGFDISRKESLSVHEQGFLLGFSNWYDLDIMCEYCINTPGFSEFQKFAENYDYRVIARTEGDEILLHDMSNGQNKLLSTNWNDFSQVKEVLDVEAYINEMFLSSVCGIQI